MALQDRLSGLPVRGQVASQPQFRNVKQRMVADLPPNVQLQGINMILSGQRSFGAQVDGFVKGLAQQGLNPEQIRQKFIQREMKSTNPLIAL